MLKKKIMAYVHQLLDQPSQWQTSQQAGPCSVPKFPNTSITVKHLLIKNKNINQSKSSLLIWHYVSYLFLLNFFSSITADFNISSALRWAIQDQWSSGLNWYQEYVHAASPPNSANGCEVFPLLLSRFYQWATPYANNKGTSAHSDKRLYCLLP